MKLFVLGENGIIDRNEYQEEKNDCKSKTNVYFHLCGREQKQQHHHHHHHQHFRSNFVIVFL